MALRFDQILNNVIIETRLISQVKGVPNPRENKNLTAIFKKSIKLAVSLETALGDRVALLLGLRPLQQSHRQAEPPGMIIVGIALTIPLAFEAL